MYMSMDVDGLSIIGPGVDYSQVGAIHQKRTLAFINHFISNTVSFLNKFARSCEQRLEKFDARIQKLDTSLSILEAKLSSISGLENASATDHPIQADGHQSLDNSKETTGEMLVTGEEPVECHQMATDTDTPKASQDPRFSRFFRMIQVGVPIQAVRQKMQAEGLDPAILDNPGPTTIIQTEWKEDSTLKNTDDNCHE